MEDLKIIIKWILIKSLLLYTNVLTNYIVKEPMNILVIRLDEIGDVVLTTPFLRELRRNYPKSRIVLIVKPAVFNLVELCPYVDEVKIFSRATCRCCFLVNIFKAYKFVKNELANESFSMAIVPRWDADCYYNAGLIALFSRARRRLAYSEHVSPSKEKTDCGFDAFYTEFVPSRPGVIHEVERNLDIIRYLGFEVKDDRLEVWTSEADKVVSSKLLPPKKRTIVVFLSTGAKRKEWSLENYISLFKKILLNNDIQIVLMGAGENTCTYAKKFLSEIPQAVNLVGKCTLRESTEVLRQADFYVGGDTGPLHLAAAVGLKGLAFYVNKLDWSLNGLDTPERFGPWKSDIEIIQPEIPLMGCEKGCHKGYAHCINTINVDKPLKIMRYWFS